MSDAGNGVWGPYCSFEKGAYQFTLRYDVIQSSEIPFVWILHQFGINVFEEVILNFDENSVTVTHAFDKKTDAVEFSLHNSGNGIIKLYSIAVEKIK